MSRFMAGCLVGLVAGLLLAPDKGENTRESLLDAAGKWKDKLNKLAGRTGAELNDLKEYLEKDIEGLTDDVRHRILTILNEAEEMAYNPNTTKNTMSNGVA